MLQGVFDKLVCVTRRSERFRHSLGALDSVIAKYFATIVGWTVVSRPFVNRDHPRHASSTPAEVYQGGLCCVCSVVRGIVHTVGDCPPCRPWELGGSLV